MKTRNVYVTRGTHDIYVEIWPDTVGIRKFHGCIKWGAAWYENEKTVYLNSKMTKESAFLINPHFKNKFGFIPRKGTAYHIDGEGKRTKVDIDFSD